MQSAYDHSLFTMKTTRTFTASLVYADDILIMGLNISKIVVVKTSLHMTFAIKDLEPVKYYFSLEIAWPTERMFISKLQICLKMHDWSHVSRLRHHCLPSTKLTHS